MDLETANELKELKRDEYNCYKERERMTNRMAFLLRGEMGKDIQDVVTGKIKVKLSFRERINYKVKNFLNKLFSIFY